MAATQGHGNPKWSRDETILALDLYLKLGGQVPSPSDPSIVALSNELRALLFHEGASKTDSFRNPDGVAFKLQNLRQLATGHGLPNVSAVDREVWRDFGGKETVVSDLARLIREGSATEGITAAHIGLVEDEEEFLEGKVVTAIHKARERNPKVRKTLIKARLASGPLSCDACEEGPKTAEPSLYLAGFESHHKVPLSATEIRSTKLTDVALLCATCHRLIHRAMHQQRRWVSIPEFRELLQQKPAQE